MLKTASFLLAIAFSLPAHAAEIKDEHSININGIGEVEVAVDYVTIYASINTRDKSLAKAKEDNQKKYAAMLGVIEKDGLNKSAIKANSTNINPVYMTCYPTPQNPEPKCDTTKINYYDVTHNIQIKLDNLEKYDNLIGDLAESGTSSVSTGQYGVSNISKYRDQARDQAIDAARGKADKIAKKLGVTLGKPIRLDSYDETLSDSSRPILMRGRAVPMMDMANGAGGGELVTDTQTMGKMKITVNVNIAYGIE